ncbi:non-ribosomal peptide synthetase [Alteromonas sp. ASW11-130]|uniref:non-ribosomal peptide synthetase n=1 Tax=Alteromonas sp. ASW11-130 TaxID=3015775 RepID=UPI002242119E|nr:non-ribosomal peptide synthetase [Alteromonas sp. ASW11-130]MCW8092498.1 amino acid adenylation domain-containing protein [Alteromonas sp. ASW11-130]
MSIDVLKDANLAGVRLFLSQGKLKVQAAKGALTPELRSSILASKPEIINILKELESFKDKDESEVIKPAPISPDKVTLSFQQQRLWVLNEITQGSPDYNMPGAYLINGDFDTGAAEKAINEVISRHDVLRTTYHNLDEEIYCKISKGVKCKIGHVDLSLYKGDEREGKLKKLLAEKSTYIFDLSSDLLIQATWFHLEDGQGVLFFNLHHIVSDGWSTDILMREFVTIYQSVIQNQDHGLLPLQIQYSDYAVWQRQYMDESRIEKQLAFWQERLNDLPVVHSLPLDFARSKAKLTEGQAFQSKMSPECFGQMQKLASEHNITPFMLVHSVLSLVISRFSGCRDIVIGTPVANRKNNQLDDLIGFFINTLVLRVNCNEQATLAEYLKQVRDVNLDAQSNQDIPFEQLIEALNLPRSMSYTPVFQIMLSMDNTEKLANSEGYLDVAPFDLGVTQAKYDITLNVSANEQGIFLNWIWDKSIFTQTTIELLDTHFRQLLQGFVDKSGSRLVDYSSSDEEEKQYLLKELNHTDASIEDLYPVLEVEQTANITPDKVAIEYDNKTVSYSELVNKVNFVASRLVEKGVEKQHRVGLALPMSIDLVVSVLAIMKVGATYVPIDIHAPQHRIDHIVDDCNMALLLTSADFPVNTDAEAILIDQELSECTSSEKLDVPSLPIAQDDIAYILYTSGSTGQPKGVAVKWQGLHNYLSHCVENYVDEQIVESVVSSPLTFDATVTTFLTPLVTGMKLRLLHGEREELTTKLGELFLDDSVQRLYKVTPAHLEVLIHQFQEKEDRVTTSSRSTVVVGGEQLLKKTVSPFMDTYTPNFLFVNEYGPTETVVGCCVKYIRNVEDLNDCEAAVSIGRPIQNIHLYVLNEQNLAPFGAVGELYIGGAGVAEGYLNKDELQQRHFIDLELALGKPERLYRTGDMVRYLKDGSLEFLGRNDEQIKLRGFRIEPSEIESQLSEHSDIDDAAVLLSEQLGNPMLVAFVVAHTDNAEKLYEELNDWCAKRLVSYMRPTTFKLVNELPLTANGKVDKQKLLQLPLHINTTSQYVAPTTELEEKLCDLFAGLLGVDQVGVNNGFFALGGDSILAIQAVSRAKKYGVVFTTNMLFENQTVASLAKVAKKSSSKVKGVELESNHSPLQPDQKRFFEGAEQCMHNCNQSVLLDVPKELNYEVFESITSVIINKHDVLRLQFEYAEDQWRAEYEPMSEHLVRSCLFEEQLPELEEDIKAFVIERSKHYQSIQNVEDGPLIKFVHFTGYQFNKLLMVSHQLLLDPASWQILINELQQGISSYKKANKVVLENKGTSFQYWGNLLEKVASSEETKAELDYWHKQLDVVPFSYSESKGEITPTNKAAALQSIELSEEETVAIRNNANSPYSTNMVELLLSGLYIAISKYTESNALPIEIQGTGREQFLEDIDISGTVGCFTSAFPHILECETTEVADVIKTIKENFRTVPRNGIGYGLLRFLSGSTELQEIEQKNKPSLSFRFIERFDLTSDEGVLLARENEAIERWPFEDIAAMNKLGFTACIINNKLRLTVDYNNGAYSKGFICNLLEEVREQFKSIITHCRSIDGKVFTPTDFPLASVSQTKLSELQKRYQIEDLYRATSIQVGMLAANELESSVYLTQNYPGLSGKIVPEHFESAWRKVVEKYSVFRTIFVPIETELHQLVLKDVEASVKIADLSKLPLEQQEKAFEQLVLSDEKKGFELESHLLYRICLVKLSEERYKILFTNHHAILDGWSMNLIFETLFEYYYAFSNEIEPDTTAEVDYVDYVRWLDSKDIDEARRHWNGYLSGYDKLAVLKLPKATSNGDSTFGVTTVTLDETHTSKLREFAKSANVTLNTLLQYAWATVLKYYTSQNDVTFGAVVTGRTDEISGVEKIVGLFVNTIPVRVKFGNENLVESLTELQNAFQKGVSYAYTPYNDIKKETGLGAGESMFETVIDFKNFPTNEHNDAPKRDDIKIEALDAFGSNNYDISLIVGVYEKLMVNCAFKDNVFERQYVEQAMQHFLEVLVQLSEVEQLEDIALTIDTGVTERSPSNAGFFTNDESLRDIFELHAKEKEEDIALVDEFAELTFGELNERANKIAHKLRALEVKPNSFVGVLVDRTSATLVSILGILKAGGAWVPLDPSAPAERNRFIVDNANINHLIDCSQSADYFGNHTVVCEYQAMMDDQRLSITNLLPLNASSQSDLAYVIHTSGSTGKPKGVMIEHTALLNLAYSMRALLDSEQLVWGEVASFSFDASVQSICHLLMGGKVVVLSEKEKLDNELLQACISRNDIDILDCTPTLVDMWIEQGAAQFLPDLIVGGEAISNNLWQHLLTRDNRAFNAYGPTECAVNSCIAEINTPEPTIGHMIPNTFGVVVDQAGNAVPNGVEGELCIGGKGLARGYVNDPQKTEYSFLTSKLRSCEGERIYKTGDIVRRKMDGSFEYLGRNDEQVKFRGYRIETGEIASKLMELDKVKAATILLEGNEFEKELIACICCTELSERSRFVEEISTYAKANLPGYMVPQKYVLVDEWPLTSSGKVDRQKLLALPVESVKAKSKALPSSDVEKLLCQMFEDILNVEGIGIDDNFYDLGGDSILAIRLVAKVSKAIRKIKVRDIFSNPTIRKLAIVIELQNEEVVGADKISGAQEILPIHQEVIFSNYDKEIFDHFNVASLFSLPGDIDISLVRTTASHILNSHDALRIKFIKQGEKVHGEYIELTEEFINNACVAETIPDHFTEEEIQTELKRLCMVHQKGFDLAKGQVFKFVVFNAPDVNRLLMLAHHAVVDVISWHILVSEVNSCLESLLAGEVIASATKSTSYQEWASYLHNSVATGTYAPEIDYWASQLAPQGINVDYDFDTDVPPLMGQRAYQAVVLDTKDTRKLLSSSKVYFDAEINELLLCGLYLGLRKWRANEAYRILVESHGRHTTNTDYDLSNTVGWFTQAYPLRFDFSPENVPKSILAVQELLNGVPNQGLGYGVLRFLEQHSTLTEQDKDPVFQIMFNYLGQFNSLVNDSTLLEFRPEDCGPVAHPEMIPIAHMAFQGGVYGENLAMNIEYDRRHFKTESIEELAGYIQGSLIEIIKLSKD